MRKITKPYKPQAGNLCWVDYEKRMAIGYDDLQWIVDLKSTNYYYPTFTMLLAGLLEHEIRDSAIFDRKAVYAHLQAVQDYLESIAKDIKLPGKSL